MISDSYPFCRMFPIFCIWASLAPIANFILSLSATHLIKASALLKVQMHLALFQYLCCYRLPRLQSNFEAWDAETFVFLFLTVPTFPVPWCSELLANVPQAAALGPFVHYISSLLPSKFNAFLGVTESGGVTCHLDGFGQIYWISIKSILYKNIV